ASHPAAGELLPHRSALTPASAASRQRRGRSVSVALSAGRPAWVLPSTLPCGVRTFLDLPPRHRGRSAAAARPTPPGNEYTKGLPRPRPGRGTANPLRALGRTIPVDLGEGGRFMNRRFGLALLAMSLLLLASAGP